MQFNKRRSIMTSASELPLLGEGTRERVEGVLKVPRWRQQRDWRWLDHMEVAVE